MRLFIMVFFLQETLKKSVCNEVYRVSMNYLKVSTGP